MTERVRKTVLVVVLLVVLSLALVVAQMRRSAALSRLDAWRSLLDHDVPAQRLEAAQRVLALDPQDTRARMVQAQALIEMHSFAKAREALVGLETADPDLRVRAMLLAADSYLQQAGQAAAGATPGSADLVAARVDPLLAELAAIRSALLGSPQAAGHLPVLEARALDIRASLLAVRLKGLDVELSKASAVESQEQVHAVGVQVGNLRAQVEELNSQLESVCQRALTMGHQDPRLYELLFQMYLRKGDLKLARQAAAALVQGDSPMEYALAGRVAGDLLNLEWSSAQPVTARDLELARGLIRHPSLSGHKAIEYWLAQVDLALAEGEWVQAEQDARKTLNIFEGHPRAAAQLALALAGQDKVDEALKVILPVNEILRSAAIRHAVGLVYNQGGQVRLAQEFWRQALEIESGALPPRLELAGAVARSGYVLEAGQDILWAWHTSPQHPGVRALYIRLLVEKLDHAELAALLATHSPPVEADDWRPAALAAWMVIDDVPVVQQLARERLAEHPGDMAALLAQAWVQAGGERRWQVAALLAHHVIERVDGDPMRRADPPGVAVRNLLPTGQQVAGRDEAPSLPVAAALDLEPFTRSRFVPWPHELALELMEAALDRWPRQARLCEAAAILCLQLGEPQRAGRWLEEWAGIDPDSPRLAAVRACLAQDYDALQRLLQDASLAGADPLGLWLRVALAVGRSDLAGMATRLEDLLVEHPWDQSGVNLVIRYALRAGEPALVQTCLETLRRVNVPLASLTSARLALALARPTDALRDLEMLVSREPGGSELRCQAAELRVRVHLAETRPEMATGVLEGLAMSAPQRKLAMQTAAVDVMLVLDRRSSAVASLTSLLAEPATPSAWLDRLLLRAGWCMGDEAMLRFLDNLLRYRPEEAILQVYRARALARMGQLDQAREILAALELRRPDSPRVLIEQARLALRSGRGEVARGYYEQLAALGGLAAAAAARDQTDPSLAAPDMRLSPQIP